jgi:Putative transposase
MFETIAHVQMLVKHPDKHGFFLPVRVLSRLFRRFFIEALEKAFAAGELEFFSALAPLRERDAFQQFLAPILEAEWVVYAKRPFAGSEQVLDYVGRYTHRVAISNNRILDVEDGKVRFRWKDYRCAVNQQKTMALSADEFIRRFLIHVLPSGFQHIRYYGFLGNRYREEKLTQCRELLGMSRPEPVHDKTDKDYRHRYEELTGVSLIECPVCCLGRMTPFRDLRPFTTASSFMDTS